jgi:hypothetical protein
MLIVCILLALIVVIEGLIIYVLQKRQSKQTGRRRSGSSGSKKEKVDWCSRFKQKETECKNIEKEFKELNQKYTKLIDIEVRYGNICMEYSDLMQANSKLTRTNEDLKHKNVDLEQKVRDLTRDNDELNKLNGIDPVLNDTETTTTVIPDSNLSESGPKEGYADNAPIQASQSSAQKVAPSEVVQEPTEEPKTESKADPKTDSSKEMTMYSSFPRSAGNNIYFSDLSENRADDSYFELKISIASGKATFKPLDFMKIRNYDPAMAAMLTEGVKPNVASTVLGIEHGKAHIEGKDWIIDKPAKIKLA